LSGNRAFLKAIGMIPNDALVKETRQLCGDALLVELDTPQGLAELLNVIPSILEQEGFPVANQADIDASATNVATFKTYLSQFKKSGRYAGEAMLRPLLQRYGASAVIIKVDGAGIIQSIYEVGGEGRSARVYLVNLLSGEPNEHFGALIPLWTPAPESRKRVSDGASSEEPASDKREASNRGGARPSKSILETAAQFPWASPVEGREGYFYCLWCAEHGVSEAAWAQRSKGAKVVGVGDLQRHTKHKTDKKWYDGNAKHEAAKVAYERARTASAPPEGVDLPLMSPKARADFMHTITAVSKVAYFIGEHELPLSLATPLCDLIAHCAPHGETLTRVDKYQNRDQVSKIVDHLAHEVVQSKMIESLRSSPLYGVGFDESTDNGGRQNLALIFSWLDKQTFCRKEAFLRLQDLQGEATGEALTAALLEFIDSNRLDRGWVTRGFARLTAAAWLMGGAPAWQEARSCCQRRCQCLFWRRHLRQRPLA
jgi:hypothetical protein